MATVRPDDRTSPSLDPRYDPLYQRGYTGQTAERRTEPRLLAPVPPSPRRTATAPPAGKDAGAPVPPQPVAHPAPAPPAAPATSAAADPPAPAPGDEGPPEAPDQPAQEQTPAATRRVRTGPLWLASVLLVVAGVLLHFTSAATGYGTDWSVFTQDGSLRFADGRSVEQVLAAQLAVAVAPPLVVLGVATAIATLFVHILRSERGTK